MLIVEDILDTGITLSKLVPVLKMRNPGSVKICTILSKPSRRMADIEPDYCGFEVPDEFVVGYGWTTTKSTATCPMWVFLSRKCIPANDKMPGVHTG